MDIFPHVILELLVYIHVMFFNIISYIKDNGIAGRSSSVCHFMLTLIPK